MIDGYTVVVDDRKAGRSIEAFTERRFAGTADLQEIKETAMELSEVQAVSPRRAIRMHSCRSRCLTWSVSAR